MLVMFLYNGTLPLPVTYITEHSLCPSLI